MRSALGAPHQLAWLHAPGGRTRAAIVVALVAFGVHAHTLGMDLVWDDFHHVQQNEMIRSLANVPRMFTTDAWAGGTRDTTATPYYRPVYKLSLALDYALWGERASGWHLTSVLLHTFASALVAVVGWSLAGGPVGALVAGLVFAVHPVHSEAVAWISARNELVCAVFMLVSLQAYLSWRGGGRGWLLPLSLVAFFVSLLGKEMSITLPALVLLHEAAFGARPGARRLAVPAAYVAVAAGYVLLRAAILEMTDWGGPPLSHRLLTSFDVVARYLRLLLLPTALRLFHEVPLQTTLTAPGVLVPLLVVAVAVVSAVLAWRADRRASFAAAWILLTLAPVTGIPAELAPARMAERYLYVPSIGFALLGGIVATLALRRAAAWRAAAPAILAALALLTVLLAVATFRRDLVWQDQATFTETWAREVPNDPLGRVGAGVVAAERGDVSRAEREYRAALAVAPGFLDAHANLGVLYDRTGRPEEAEREYLAALAIDPRNPEVLYDLGVHFLGLARFADAERAFRKAIEVNPAASDAHYNLALLALSAGATERAVEHLARAVEIEPENASYRTALEDARQAASRHRR